MTPVQGSPRMRQGENGKAKKGNNQRASRTAEGTWGKHKKRNAYVGGGVGEDVRNAGVVI